MAKKDEDKKKAKKAGKRGPGRPPKEGKRGPGRPPKSEKAAKKAGKRGPGRPSKAEREGKRGPGRPPKARTLAAGGAFRVSVIGNVVRVLRGSLSEAAQGVSITYTQGKHKIQRDVAAENVAIQANGVLYIGGTQVVAEFVAESYTYDDGIYTLETAQGTIKINGKLLTVEIEKLVGAADDEETNDEKPAKKKAKKGKKPAKGDLDALEDEDDEDDESEDDDDDSDEDDEDDDSDDDSDEDDEDDDSDDEDDDDSEDDDSDDEDDSEDEESEDDEGGEWNL